MASAPVSAPRALEAKTIRKLKTHILPFVFVLFVINFVDWINIGFAALMMKGVGYHKPAVRTLVGDILLGLFYF